MIDNRQIYILLNELLNSLIFIMYKLYNTKKYYEWNNCISYSKIIFMSKFVYPETFFWITLTHSLQNSYFIQNSILFAIKLISNRVFHYHLENFLVRTWLPFCKLNVPVTEKATMSQLLSSAPWFVMLQCETVEL